MNYDETVSWLLNHANLPSADTQLLSEEHSFACSFSARSRLGRDDINRLFDDVLDCLIAVNLHINGPTPSASAGPQRAIEPAIAYAIPWIFNCAIESYRAATFDAENEPQHRERLGEVAWCLACVWEQVLAGDIDNLREAIELEGQICGMFVDRTG